MGTKNPESDEVKVIYSSPVTPHNKALYEAGKEMLVESINTSREFCKSMISISTGAIPVYLGLLAAILPKDYALGKNAGWTLAWPAILFLVTTIIFVAGYLPVFGKFSLDIIDEIKAARKKILRWRLAATIIGMIFFTASTALAIITIIINIGVR